MSAVEIISLGCRLNACEGEAMRRLAERAGVADAVVINSCAVTNEAERQTRQTIRRARRENPHAKIVVTGCAVQVRREEFEAMDEVDAVLGNSRKLDAASWAALANGARALHGDFFDVRETAAHLVDGYDDRARAFLQVQNGCDHRCTFCIIPFGRGPSRSVPLDEAVDAAERLVESGHREIVLTGVDLTAWGADLPGAFRLGDLVAAILDRTAVFRLRLSSLDGAEADETLCERIAGDARVAPHVHLSLQSGDDLILKRMKRRHTRKDAIALCERLRARRPNIAVGADLIAGFPTETEEMFARSLELIDEAGLQYVHAFAFSPRKGTPAARMPQVDRAVIKERARRLKDKGEAVTARFLDSLVGRVEDAVAESGARARLGNFAAVRLAEPAPAGAVVRTRIYGRDGLSLLGAVEGSASA
jgi:threonylcarbamoyladenosine tRNA methylthiotransferase MtaB